MADQLVVWRQRGQTLYAGTCFPPTGRVLSEQPRFNIMCNIDLSCVDRVCKKTFIIIFFGRGEGLLLMIWWYRHNQHKSAIPFNIWPPPKEDIFFQLTPPPPSCFFFKLHTLRPPPSYFLTTHFFYLPIPPPPTFSRVTKIVRLSLYVPKEDIGPTLPPPYFFFVFLTPPPCIFFIFLPPPPLYFFVFLPPTPTPPHPHICSSSYPPPLFYISPPPPRIFSSTPPPRYVCLQGHIDCPNMYLKKT